MHANKTKSDICVNLRPSAVNFLFNNMKPLLCIVALLISSQIAAAQWIKQTVNTTASFRGLSVVSEKVIWASGTGGTVLGSVDGGKNWTIIKVPDA